MKVGIIGATGYAGQQLVWLLTNHKKVELYFLASHSYANTSYTSIYSNYNKFIHNSCISMHDLNNFLDHVDVVFIALPHGKSMDMVEDILSKRIKVIDLGADFRLKDYKVYEEWYDLSHGSRELLKQSVYGLPELNRNLIKDSELVANPGCYPTASILALAPLAKNNLIDVNTIIIDAKSGVSGAGRSTNTSNLFCECNESIKAYKVSSHRHTPEIEQELSNLSKENINLIFTPHLVPMNRGILATCYSKLKKKITLKELYNLYEEFYSGNYFIRIIEDIPETRWVKGSNFCDIGIRLDSRTNSVIVVSAIDNLIKGASGQAVQNMNIIFGFDEWEGLNFPSMMP